MATVIGPTPPGTGVMCPTLLNTPTRIIKKEFTNLVSTAVEEVLGVQRKKKKKKNDELQVLGKAQVKF